MRSKNPLDIATQRSLRAPTASEVEAARAAAREIARQHGTKISVKMGTGSVRGTLSFRDLGPRHNLYLAGVQVPLLRWLAQHGYEGAYGSSISELLHIPSADIHVKKRSDARKNPSAEKEAYVYVRDAYPPCKAAVDASGDVKVLDPVSGRWTYTHELTPRQVKSVRRRLGLKANPRKRNAGIRLMTDLDVTQLSALAVGGNVHAAKPAIAELKRRGVSEWNWKRMGEEELSLQFQRRRQPVKALSSAEMRERYKASQDLSPLLRKNPSKRFRIVSTAYDPSPARSKSYTKAELEALAKRLGERFRFIGNRASGGVSEVHDSSGHVVARVVESRRKTNPHTRAVNVTELRSGGYDVVFGWKEPNGHFRVAPGKPSRRFKTYKGAHAAVTRWVKTER